MAARFWVGGTGNWDAATTTNWAASSGGAGGQSVPTSGDTVTFDTLSNATSYTVTITATANCSDLTIGQPLTGTLTFAGSSALNMFGNFSVASGVNRSFIGQMNFVATATGKTLTFNSVVFASDAVFNGAGGGWTLQDDYNNNSKNLTLTQGALDTNGKTVTCNVFQFDGSSTRTLTLGASTVFCNTVTASTTTNLTFNANTSTISMISATNPSFMGGGLTYNTVTISNFNNVPTFTGANTFTTLNLTNGGGALQIGKVTLSDDQVVTGTLTISGSSAANRALIASAAVGTARTITAAVVALTNTDFRDITAAGAASPFTGTSLGNFAGNTNITFTTPVTRFWVGGTGSYSSTTHWSTSSGGASGASVPICHDTVNFDANSFTTSGRVVTFDIPRMSADMNCTGVVNAPSFSCNSIQNSVQGTLTLVAGITITGTQLLKFVARSSKTLTSAGVAFSQPITYEAPGGTLTLQDALTITSQLLTLTMGTFDANNFNVTAGSFDGSNSNTRTLTNGSGTWTVTGTGTVWTLSNTTGLTFNANTSTIIISNVTSTAKSFVPAAAGTQVYSTVRVDGDNVMLSPAFTATTINLNNPGLTTGTLFANSATFTTTNFTAQGSAGNLTVFGSNSGSLTSTLSKAGFNTDCDFVSVTRMIGIGGARWFMGEHSTNSAGNKGLRFGQSSNRQASGSNNFQSI